MPNAPADRRPPSIRAHYRAFRNLTTRWADNDIYGHMNNTVHYALFDSAVNGWLIENGLLDLKAGTEIGLVVETGCRYHRELAFPETVTAGIAVAAIGNTSVRYEVGLFRGEEATAAADGFFVHVHVDRATRRPVRLGEALRTKLQEITT